jgi:hypothetical protein
MKLRRHQRRQRPLRNELRGLREYEHWLTTSFRGRSRIAVYPQCNITTFPMEEAVAEFIRNGLIILMGMTVMVAGILVVFYG